MLRNEYEAELDDFLDNGRLWRYYDPELEEKPKTVAAYPVSGPFGGLEGPGGRESFDDDKHDKPMTRIILHGGHRVDGIEVFYGGESGGLHGKATNALDVTLEAGESIVGSYGRSGEAVDRFSILPARNLPDIPMVPRRPS